MTQALRVTLITVGVVAGFLLLMFSFLFAGRDAALSVQDPVPLSPPVETTVAATVEHQLAIAYPEVGDVVTSPLTIEGVATASQLGYRLFGGGMPLAEGTIVVDGEGRFSTTVEFSNTCCIELTLEVFDMQPDAGLGFTIPLAYPETS